jgi:hypothetical protein
VFTTTKAPMAHKKNSKEQFRLQYFLFKISFKISPLLKNFTNNELLFFILFNKKAFIFFETNLFFLKNFNIILKTKNTTFFNIFEFLNKKSI